MTRLTPFVFIPDTVDSILDYLVQRTAHTTGELVDRSQLIIVGSVEDVDARIVRVRPEDINALKPWLSGEAGTDPHIIIHVTRVRVEKSLVGARRAKEVEIAYPGVGSSGAAGFPPIFQVQERGILFLREIPPDAPYAPYIDWSAYQLVPRETGMRSFLVTDYDERGRPLVRDETARVEETIEAVRWYNTLPRKEAKALHQVLLQALNNTNTRVVRHAIRALAREGNPTVAQLFKNRLLATNEELRVRVLLGLWILGEQKAARNILEETFKEQGKYQWLARWGVEPALMEAGQRADTLCGPDPLEVKGD